MNPLDGSSCLFEIHARRDGMSEKERIVADYILAAPSEAVHPSIEELSERIGVSESTLFRFVRKLGYEGYQQFRIALATETVEPRSRIFEAPVGEDESVRVVFGASISALELTMEKLDRSALQKTAELLVRARTTLLLGLGGSGIVARDAYHKLLRTGIACSAPEDYHLQLMAASQAGPEDAAVMFSHTGANKDSIAIADSLKRAGVPLVGVSTYPRSPFAKLCDLMLISTVPAAPFISEAFSARIAQLAIVDCVYVEVMERRGEGGAKSLESMRAVIAKRRT